MSTAELSVIPTFNSHTTHMEHDESNILLVRLSFVRNKNDDAFGMQAYMENDSWV